MRVLITGGAGFIGGTLARAHRDRGDHEDQGRRAPPSSTGHGITDLLKTVTPRDVASDAELRAGVGPLWQRAALWRPGAVVFVYKRAAEAVAGRRLAEPWGVLEGVALAGRPCILLPGPYATSEQVEEGIGFLRNLAAALPPVAVPHPVAPHRPPAVPRRDWVESK